MDTFDKWAVGQLQFTEALQKVEVGSPRTGETCHGCVMFRATYKGPFGFRLPLLDLPCDKVVKRDRFGYCECGGGYFPRLFDIDHETISCKVVCSKADFKKLHQRPIKVTLRVQTSKAEGAESKQTPTVTFADSTEHIPMGSLPPRNVTVEYDMFLQRGQGVTLGNPVQASTLTPANPLPRALTLYPLSVPPAC
jgi:hypothetical protein